MNTSGRCAFCFAPLLVIDSITLIDTGLFQLSSSHVSFGRLRLQGMSLFHLVYQICGHRVLHGILITLLTFLGLPGIAPFSLLILVIYVLSLFLGQPVWILLLRTYTELLDDGVILPLIFFREITIPFSITAAQVHIPTGSAQESWFLHTVFPSWPVLLAYTAST